MGKKDRTPEEREQLRRMLLEGERSRQQLQEAWDNLREKWRLAGADPPHRPTRSRLT